MDRKNHGGRLLPTIAAAASNQSEPTWADAAPEHPAAEAARLLRELRERAAEIRVWLVDFGPGSQHRF